MDSIAGEFTISRKQVSIQFWSNFTFAFGETVLALSFGSLKAAFFLALFGLFTNILGLTILTWTLC